MYGKTPPPSMLGHPSFGYRRPPGRFRRSVGMVAGISAAVVVIVPWWVGVAALLGAFNG